MFDQQLEIAYRKSDEIIKAICFPSDNMIDSSEVIDYIEQKMKVDIDIFFRSFKKLGIDKPYGAMMMIEFENEEAKNNCQPSKANIVLNTDSDDAVFQRFSLFHELGHLVTLTKDNLIHTENYVVSTHIDYELTNISPNDYKENAYLLKEQIANIFALRVLMPSKMFYKKMREYNDITKVADFFGVTQDAVLSRMMIGA